MAFRVLSEEELSLLDEKQREQYESDLIIYQHRVAFVEQLELHENAKIEPYEPQLSSITVIDEIEKREYATPEYKVSVSFPEAKQELYVRPFEMTKPVDPVLEVLKGPEVHLEHITKIEVASPKLPLVRKPVAKQQLPEKLFELVKPVGPVLEVLKRPEVHIEHITKMDIVSPKLPLINKPEAPTKGYKKIEIEKPNLPVAVKVNSSPRVYNQLKRQKAKLKKSSIPVIQTDFHFAPVSYNPKDIQTSLPNIVVPNADFNVFSYTKDTKHSLPEVAVHFADIKGYNTPERLNIALPVVNKPVTNVTSFELAEPIQVNLLELPKSLVKDPLKSNTPNLDTMEGLFKKPKHVKPKLPNISKLGLPPKTFNGYNINALEIPEVTKISVTENSFKAPQKPSVSITTTEPLIAKVEPFKKMELEINNVTSLEMISIPDAHKEINDLLPLINESLGEVGGKVS
jgi:hypothetical protein